MGRRWGRWQLRPAESSDSHRRCSRTFLSSPILGESSRVCTLWSWWSSTDPCAETAGDEQPVGSSGCYLSIVVGRVAAIHGFTGMVVGGDALWKCWGEHSQGLGSFVWPTLSHGWILHAFGHQDAQRWNDSFSSFSPGASYKPLRLIIYA